MSTDRTRLCCLYAKAGGGKTTDAVAAIPFGDVICLPDAIDPARTTLGLDYDPDHVFEVHSMAEASDTLAYIAERKLADPDDPRTGVLLDDVSVLARFRMEEMDRTYSDKRAMWGDLGREILTLTTTMESIPDLVVVTAHERAYDPEKAAGIRGGPWFPSKNQTEPFCGPFHEVLRLVREASYSIEWKGAYECKPGDPFMVTKARCGMAKAKSPANLAELLRAGGYEVPRHPDLEWMEAWVSEVYEGLMDKGAKGWGKLSESVTKHLDGVDDLHVKWVLRDGYHRFMIRSAHKESAKKP